MVWLQFVMTIHGFLRCWIKYRRIILNYRRLWGLIVGNFLRNWRKLFSMLWILLKITNCHEGSIGKGLDKLQLIILVGIIQRLCWLKTDNSYIHRLRQTRLQIKNRIQKQISNNSNKNRNRNRSKVAWRRITKIKV